MLQETSLLYIQFRASIEPLKKLIHEIEQRSQRQEYTVFLIDCFDCYCEQRKQLLYKVISKRVEELVKQNDLVNFVRVGSSYIIQTCIQEDKLFKHFFTSEKLSKSLK